MLQILGILPNWNEISYNIVANLYSTVARIYDILLTLSGYGEKTYKASDNFYLSTTDFATTIYTLAGVFMLFRVTIAMVNYLINPDQITDRNAGAGKIITRIITSLAMLIIFVPNGFIFGDDGVLKRVEEALLEKDGLIYSSIPGVNATEGPKETDKKPLFIDNVEAEANKMDCYYIYVINTKNKNANKGSRSTSSKKTKTNIYENKTPIHITFYNAPAGTDSGEKKLCTKKGKNCNKYSYTVDTSTSDGIKYKNIDKNLIGTSFKNGFPSTDNCPNQINKSGKTLENNKNWYDKSLEGIVGGWPSPESLKNDLEKRGMDVVKILCKDGKEEECEELQKYTGINNSNQDENAKKGIFSGLRDESIVFAQTSMSSFIECNGDEDECDANKENMLKTSEGNDAVVEAMNAKPPTLVLDFMIAVIAGVGICVWLIFLCVEVIIRRFKLMLLEMIAPIPIISYSDPKDKMFGEWSKMYISTYLELFLKLFAISFAIALLQNLAKAVDGAGLLLFFYIVAILVFAKMIPDMLSNIFGIKNMSGSFKNIMGMGKAALGFGAGAAIGGVVGATSALGKGGGVGMATAGALKGALRGAGSGANGKILGGADSIRKDNLNTRRANINGSTAAGRTTTAVKRFFGRSDPYESDKKKLDLEEEDLKPEKERKAALDAYNASQKAWEKEITTQKGYHNFDHLPEVQDFYKAKAENQKLKTGNAEDFRNAKDAWYSRNYEKANALYEAAKTSGNAADMQKYNDFQSEIDNKYYKMSDIEFMAAHDAEVSQLDYSSTQAAMDYEWHKLATDRDYDGIPGDSKKLYTNTVSRMLEVDPSLSNSPVTSYKGSKGLKEVGVGFSNESNNLEQTIGQKERSIETRRRELENSGKKADHDAVSGGN